MQIIETVLKNIFTTLYEQTGFCLLLGVMSMFFYMYAEEHGWKSATKKWWKNFWTDARFRRMFLLVTYSSMLLFRTLFNRRMWMNPIENIMAGWGLYNEKGEITTQAIENIILFLPLIFLLFWNLHYKIFEKRFTFWEVILKSAAITFTGSLAIESCQLFFRLGTMQLADLCYNTIGGLLGGILYYCYVIISRKCQKRKDD